jgi:hypothetical protein
MFRTMDDTEYLFWPLFEPLYWDSAVFVLCRLFNIWLLSNRTRCLSLNRELSILATTVMRYLRPAGGVKVQKRVNSIVWR